MVAPITFNIVLYGDKVESHMLVYYIDQYLQQQQQLELIELDEMLINVTLITSIDQTAMINTLQNVRYGTTNDPESIILMLENQMNKKLSPLCGIQNQFLSIMSKTDLQYDIKKYSIYFGMMNQQEKDKQAGQYVISTSAQYTHAFENIKHHGLSHYAAVKYFEEFAQFMNASNSFSSQLNPTSSVKKLSDLSLKYILKKYINTDLEQNGFEFLEEDVGLDYSYIKDYIFPIVWASYLHEPSILSTLVKVLPIYCKNKKSENILVLFEDIQTIKMKMVELVKNVKINYITNTKIESYYNIKKNSNDRYDPDIDIETIILLNKNFSKNNTFDRQAFQYSYNIEPESFNEDAKNYTKRVNYTYLQSKLSLKSNTFFIFQNYNENANIRQISYYKTIVDGYLHGDSKFTEEFFTMYMRIPTDKANSKDVDDKFTKKNVALGPNHIFSITRFCSEDCENYHKHAYLLISKHKITSKDLNIFRQFEILLSKKCWRPKTQIPSQHKRIEEIKNVYRISDIDIISDNYEIKLNLMKQIGKSTVDQIKRFYSKV